MSSGIRVLKRPGAATPTTPTATTTTTPTGWHAAYTDESLNV